MMLQTLFLYPVAFPQLIRDSVLVARDGRLTQAAINKSNLFGLMFMFVGILSVIVFSALAKIYNVSLRRLAIALPFLSAVTFGGQLALIFVWEAEARDYPDRGDPAPATVLFQQRMEALLQALVYLSGFFMMGYWPICYILALNIAPKIGQSITSGMINAGACLVALFVFVVGFRHKIYLDPYKDHGPKEIDQYAEWYFRIAVRILILEISLTFLSGIINIFLNDYALLGNPEDFEESEYTDESDEEEEEERK